MTLIADPFHAGERAVQQLMGGQQAADKNSSVLQTVGSDRVVANIFNADVAALATRVEGKLRVDLVSGARGFARLVESSRVRMKCDHPLPAALVEGIRQQRLIGGVTIAFSTRQRARVNGYGTVIDSSTVDIAGKEIFFNCNKYIAKRRPIEIVPPPGLRPSAETLVSSADVFFIGSADSGSGLDASHRGGHRGLLTLDAGRLSWTEYPGNDMYQTMGNLYVEREVAVVVPDFSSGLEVHVHGTAEIEIRDAIHVSVEVDDIEVTDMAITRRWVLDQPSPHNPPA